MLWMVLGALSGALIPVGFLPALHAQPLLLHQFLMMFGWMFQFTMAVAWWMFPRLGRNQRPSNGPMWGVAAFVQAAVLLIIITPGQLLLASGLLLLAALLFISSIGKRVKPRGKRT